MSTINGEFRSKIAYAHVHEPSQYGHFEVNVEVTPEIEKQLIEYRLEGKIKSGKANIFDGGKHLPLRTTQVDRGGNVSSIIVVDSNGKPMKDLVGNGSECITYWRAYDDPKYGRVIKFGKMLDWDQEGKTKTFAGLKVVSLIEYKNDKNTFFTPVDNNFSAALAAVPKASKEVSFELED